MYIESLRLRNFGQFADLEIPLWPDDRDGQPVTVFIGENGSGKSCIIEAVRILLSWLVARIRSESGNGSPIDELRIRNDSPEAGLELTLVYQKEKYSWSLSRSRKGYKKKIESYLRAATQLANQLRLELMFNGNAPLPLMVCYPTERYVLDIPKRVRSCHLFDQIAGYDEALTFGIDFRRFFEWFRDREDLRNEGLANLTLAYFDINKIRQHSSNYIPKEQFADFLDTEKIRQEKPALAAQIADPQYLAVLEAIAAFMPGYKNLRIQRRPRMRMLITKGDEDLNILQLSQGERSLLALVGDIARRLAMMNPQAEKPLHGKGIVLIDEVDLHLHPRWQRTVIRRLRETFPNCHFILTTHSPLVISDPQHIRVLQLQNGEVREPGNLYGMDLEELLLGVMDTDIRDPELQKTSIIRRKKIP